MDDICLSLLSLSTNVCRLCVAPSADLPVVAAAVVADSIVATVAVCCMCSRTNGQLTNISRISVVLWSRNSVRFSYAEIEIWRFFDQLTPSINVLTTLPSSRMVPLEATNIVVLMSFAELALATDLFVSHFYRRLDSDALAVSSVCDRLRGRLLWMHNQRRRLTRSHRYWHSFSRWTHHCEPCNVCSDGPSQWPTFWPIYCIQKFRIKKYIYRVEREHRKFFGSTGRECGRLERHFDFTYQFCCSKHYFDRLRRYTIDSNLFIARATERFRSAVHNISIRNAGCHDLYLDEYVDVFCAGRCSITCTCARLMSSFIQWRVYVFWNDGPRKSHEFASFSRQFLCFYYSCCCCYYLFCGCRTIQCSVAAALLFRKLLAYTFVSCSLPWIWYCSLNLLYYPPQKNDFTDINTCIKHLVTKNSHICGGFVICHDGAIHSAVWRFACAVDFSIWKKMKNNFSINI